MSIQLKRSLTSNLNTNHILKQGQIGIEMPAATNSAGNPFKMKIGDGTSKYSALPYFGTAATTAEMLANPPYIAVDLSNRGTLTSFDGANDVNNIRITGTLGLANGGTGVNSLSALKSALGISNSSTPYVYVTSIVAEARDSSVSYTTLNPGMHLIEQNWQIPTQRPYYHIKWDLFKVDPSTGSYSSAITRRGYTITNPDGTVTGSGSYTSDLVTLKWSNWSSSYKSSKIKQFLISVWYYATLNGQSIQFSDDFSLIVADAY